MKETQYQKKGIALVYLAKKFFTLEVGDRIPTIDELCEDTNTSRGTMQGALETLKNDDAIQTVSKGHLGTYLVDCNQDKLINYLDDRNIVCAMPLPYTKYYEGLSTGFYKSFENKKLNLNLAYINGSVNRLNGLESNRYDFIVTSGLTAEYLLEHNDVEMIAMFPEQTYVSEHVIVHKKDQDNFSFDGMSIGVDSNSIDYRILTHEIVRNYDVKMVETPYNQIVRQIENGSIDAAIWNKDEVKEKNYPVSYDSINSDLVKKSSCAALLCKKGNNFIKEIIQEYADVEKIIKVQKSVISGETLPEY